MNARYPTYIYKNPVGVCRDDILAAKGIMGQLDVAAAVVRGTVRFGLQCLNETLEPDEFKGITTCMLQYGRMFGSCRIPGKEKDSFRNGTDEEEKFFVVTRGGGWWKVKCGEGVSHSAIKQALKTILEDKVEDGQDVGVLTTARRSEWAGWREKLIEGGNSEQLEAVEKSMFVLCLDEEGGEDLRETIRQAVVGGTGGRWYDKPLNLIITANGKLAVNSEHSWGDGIALVRWGKEVVEDLEREYREDFDASNDDSISERITWKLDDGMKETIRKQTRSVEKEGATWTGSEFYWKGYGAKFCKENKISPDAMVQQALMLAYRKLEGEFPGAYSVGQQVAFKGGRNERVRGGTGVCKDFVEGAQEREGDVDWSGNLSRLRKACDRQKQVTRMALMGNGFDRHVYCLSQLAEKDGVDVELFKDPIFTKLMTDTLCSSSLDANFVEVMVANPAFSDFDDGGEGKDKSEAKGRFFIVYSTRNDEVRFSVNGFEGSGDVEAMGKEIQAALGFLRKIVVKGGTEEVAESAKAATGEDVWKDVVAVLMKDDKVKMMFANPKFKAISMKIMSDPTLLENPMKNFRDELKDKSVAKAMMGLVPKVEKAKAQLRAGTPEDTAEATPAKKGSPSQSPEASPAGSSEASSERAPSPDSISGEVSAQTPQTSKKQSRNTFLPADSESSGSVLQSQQTVEKKKRKVRRVRRAKGQGIEEESEEGRSQASSPAFSEDYLNDKENELMEEEVTRAIATANKNKDLKELTIITSLFGEGSKSEVRAAVVEARKYLDMAKKRDAIRNKIESGRMVTAASPRAEKKHLSGLNPDGKPFSKAQLDRMKRRRACKEGNMIPPQASVWIQAVWRGKVGRRTVKRMGRAQREIARIWRGWNTRCKTSKALKRWRGVVREEKHRNVRVNRIAKQRAELAMLRRTKADELGRVDGWRRTRAARMIQRWARGMFRKPWFVRKHGKKNRIVVRKDGDYTVKEGRQGLVDEIEEGLEIEVNEDDNEVDQSMASFWSRASVNASQAEEDREGFDVDFHHVGKKFSTPAFKIKRSNYSSSLGEASALRLADLQRRVATTAQEARREKEKKEREMMEGVKSNYRARRGYEKLLEVQQEARMRLAERTQVEEGESEKAIRRRKRLDRFERLSRTMENMPTLGKVKEEFVKRKTGKRSEIKEVMRGWKIPESQRGRARAFKMHNDTMRAMRDREEWYSLNVGAQFGGGRVDLRTVAEVDVEGEMKEESMGMYDEDDKSMFWWIYCSQGRDTGSNSSLLRLRTKEGSEGRIERMDEGIEESRKRGMELEKGIVRRLAREQRLMKAPEELDRIQGGRVRKLYNAAVHLQRIFRGGAVRTEVRRELKERRVKGALEMIVRELGGGEVKGLGGLLGGLGLGGGGGGGGLTMGGGGKSLFGGTKIAWGAGASKTQKGSGKGNVFGKGTAKTWGGEGKTGGNSAPSTPARGEAKGENSLPGTPSAISAIQVASGTPATLEVKTRGADMGLGSVTPIMVNMLIDVDLGLGSHNKPHKWTPGKVVGVGPRGVEVEFEDGDRMKGVDRGRVRVRGGTPDTGLLERRLAAGRGEEGKVGWGLGETPVSEVSGTPSTVQLERMRRDNSFKSFTSEGSSDTGRGDIERVIEAVERLGDKENMSTAENAVLSIEHDVGGKVKEDGKEGGGEGIVIPKLNIPSIGSESPAGGGYVSPASTSPLRSPTVKSPTRKGREAGGKILSHVVGMKKERGGKNTNILGSTGGQQIEAGRIRSVMVGARRVFEKTGFSVKDVMEQLDMDDNGFVGADDVVDFLVCVDVSLGTNLNSIADVKSVGICAGTWLEKTGGVNVKELMGLWDEWMKWGDNWDERIVGLEVGRRAKVRGEGGGMGGKEVMVGLWDTMAPSVDEFKRGLAKLKVKLSANEVEGIVKVCKVGEVVNVQRVVELCFSEGGSGNAHRDLQRSLKKYFDRGSRRLEEFLLLMGDVDYDNSGYVDWRRFMRQIDHTGEDVGRRAGGA